MCQNIMFTDNMRIHVNLYYGKLQMLIVNKPNVPDNISFPKKYPILQ